MYLTCAAASATLRTLRGFGGARSQLALTYMQAPSGGRTALLRARLARALSPAMWAFWLLARRAGESFRNSYTADEMRAWLAEHGAQLRWDRGYEEIAAELNVADRVPPALLRGFLLRGGTSPRHRFVLADVAPEAAAAAVR